MASTHFPVQGAATGKPWSLVRDSQFREELEAALHSAVGAGVVSGGAVAKTAAMTVELAAGTVIFNRGVLYTVPTAVSSTILNASATVQLWGKITRAAANQDNPGDEDTYTFPLSTTVETTPTPPSADHVHLATIVTDSGPDITSVDDNPPGKYVRAGSAALVGNLDTIPVWMTTIQTGLTEIWGGTLTIKGVLEVHGQIRVVD
jgi:hypothetical protein